MHPVVSSNIKSMGYDQDELAMYIVFHNEQVWKYYPLQRDEFDMIRHADSIGKMFNEHVRNNKLVTSEKIV